MDNDQLWQAILGELEVSLSKANFTTWFKNTYIIEQEDKKITVAVPNTFTKTWLENKYHDFILKALKKITNNNFNEVLKDFYVDGIIHLASVLPYSGNLVYNDFYIGNVKTTLNIINFTKARNGRRFRIKKVC